MPCNPDPSPPVTSAADYFSGPMWGWFSLSYAAYLVVPRAALCTMPEDWQARMVALLEEMNDTIEWDGESDYVVSVRKAGKFASDPLCNYRYPPRDGIRFKIAEASAR
jgi:hypothetical protein